MTFENVASPLTMMKLRRQSARSTETLLFGSQDVRRDLHDDAEPYKDVGARFPDLMPLEGLVLDSQLIGAEPFDDKRLVLLAPALRGKRAGISKC